VLIAGLAKTRREAYLIARNSLGHFAGHVCEALRISDVITQKNWQNHVSLEMTPAVRELIFSTSEPVILATGHLGAWEAGITAITSVRPMFAVARLMDNLTSAGARPSSQSRKAFGVRRCTIGRAHAGR